MSFHVVIQTAFIGDVFLSIPFLKRLRELYPEDEIVYVAKKGVADFFFDKKIIDQLITIEKGNSKSYKKALLELKAKGHAKNVFCLHRSFRSALFSWKINGEQKIGFRHVINSLFFDRSVVYPKELPDALRQLSLLASVDSKIAEQLCEKDLTYLNFTNAQGKFDPIPLFASMNLSLKNQAGFTTDQKMKSQRQIALFPGSVWPTKKWPLDSFIHLAQKLILDQHQIYIMGGPDETELAQKIQRSVPEVRVLAGQMKLVESIQFLETCDLIICNDSSPSHLGASVGTPVVAVFGPTTLNLGFRPWNDQSFVVENNELDCRPCGLHGHKKCPLVHHRCMTDISVEQVYSIVCKAL